MRKIDETGYAVNHGERNRGQGINTTQLQEIDQLLNNDTHKNSPVSNDMAAAGVSCPAALFAISEQPLLRLNGIEILKLSVGDLNDDGGLRRIAVTVVKLH